MADHQWGRDQVALGHAQAARGGRDLVAARDRDRDRLNARGAQHVDHGRAGAGRTGADDRAPAQGFSTDQDLDVLGNSRVGRAGDEVFKVA